MIILPAIDLLGGRCVRLSKGEYDTAREVAADPMETAERFYLAAQSICTPLTLTEQSTAKDKKKTVGSSARSQKKAGSPWKSAAESVPLTTSVGHSTTAPPESFSVPPRPILYFWRRRLPGSEKALPSESTQKDGLVATSGWTKTGTLGYLDFAKTVAGLGVGTIIFTDIGRDGMLTGPNTEMLKALRSALPGTALIASGGVKSAEDIRELKVLGMSGAICGKSLYAGTLDLGKAIRAARD